MARIIAVADTLDAMTTNRPYQTAMDLEFAMNRIHSWPTRSSTPPLWTPCSAPSAPENSA